MGLMKPDFEIYQLVLNDTNLNPQEILFVDDNLEKIEAARNFEFQGCHVDNLDDTRNKINELLFKKADPVQLIVRC